MEFEKWKRMFKIEEKGEKKNDKESEKNMISKFIEYIKMNKLVNLEDLSIEFELTT
jgi:hypothetical protein